MKALRAVRISMRAPFVHKLRAGLALSSVAVGVAAVIVTGALGEGAKREVLRETDSMGANLLVVRPAQVRFTAARRDISGVVSTLKLDDCAVISQLDFVREVVPGYETSLVVKAGVNSMSVMVLGATAPYLELARYRLRAGRFLQPDDDSSARRVAVLASRVDENLFGTENPVGQQVRIGQIPFDVVGVLESKGVLADGSDEDNRVIIPIRTALRRVFNLTWLNPVFVSVRSPAEIDAAREQIADLLRDQHHLNQNNKPDDFLIQDKTKVLATERQLAQTLTLVATSLAGASLVIGGTGILALMLMSVKERTGEIGLRIAVGARPKDVLLQFLLEAVFVAAGGWLLGVTLGGMVAILVSLATAWKIALSASLILTTLGGITLTGLLFGTYPARKAALLPPYHALRAE